MAEWTFKRTSPAAWIWHREVIDSRHDHALFFGDAKVPPGAVCAKLKVSADNRYVLHVDSGDGPLLVGFGPARSDPRHTKFDEYKIQTNDHLRIWAECRWICGRPEAYSAEMHTQQPGFWCEISWYDDVDQLIAVCGTDETWGALCVRAIEPLSQRQWLGAYERHFGDRWPADWLVSLPAWTNASEVGPYNYGAYFRGDEPWAYDEKWLIPSDIPNRQLQVRQQSVDPPICVKRGQTDARILAFDDPINAYVAFELVGRGAMVRVRYAERLLVDGKKSFVLTPEAAVDGPYDEFQNRNARCASYRTFDWRAFRFLEITVVAGEEDAEIRDFSTITTEYPWAPQLELHATGDRAADIDSIVDVSWRTIERCTWETYMDCPFYEQLQYVGDTRLQALVTQLVTGDDRLWLQSLRAFHRSRDYSGLTQSRYPNQEPQIIPTFSLIFILMVDDYRQFVGDLIVLKELWSTVIGVLTWFREVQNGRGKLIGKVPFWPFVDWVDGWWFGVPPAEYSSAINLTFLLALQAAARIAKSIGLPDAVNLELEADEFAKIVTSAFVTLEGLISEGLSDDSANEAWSQHAQALGALAGIIDGDTARTAIRNTLGTEFANKPVKAASFYFRFYVAEAAAKLRMKDVFWVLMDPFVDAMRLGSRTWPESLGSAARSECHAWGSWPLYYLIHHAAGIKNDAGSLPIPGLLELTVRKIANDRSGAPE